MQFNSTSIFTTANHSNWLGGYFDSQAQADQKTLTQIREQLRQTVGQTVEPLPEVISRHVFEQMLAIAGQRARAAKMFCADIYRNENPAILRENVRLREVLKTNTHFFTALIGSSMAKNVSWDFVMALDWTFEIQSGMAHVRPIESDTGGVGGVLRMALIHEGMKGLLPKKPFHENMEDGAAYLHALFRRFKAHAGLGMDDKSIGLLLTEDDIQPLLTSKEPSALSHWLDELGIHAISSWNREMLSVLTNGKTFLFNGKDVKGIWLRYYSSALDPTFRGYSRIANTYCGEVFDKHNINGFWENYLDGAFSNCYVNNPIGVELFTDKATGSFINYFIRYYLSEEPLLDDQCYEIFCDVEDKRAQTINRVFASKDDWVIKSRATTGAGAGVVFGCNSSNAEWNDLKNTVESSPTDFVAQPYYEAAPFCELGGKSSRYPEFRVLTYGMSDNHETTCRSRNQAAQEV